VFKVGGDALETFGFLPGTGLLQGNHCLTSAVSLDTTFAAAGARPLLAAIGSLGTATCFIEAPRPFSLTTARVS
jgi:hypothetical protein